MANKIGMSWLIRNCNKLHASAPRQKVAESNFVWPVKKITSFHPPSVFDFNLAVEHWEWFSNFNAEEIFWFWMLMLLVVSPRRWCCCAWIAFPTRCSTRAWLCRCADFGDLNCLFCLTCLVCRSESLPNFWCEYVIIFFCGTFAALLLKMFRRVATFKSTHWHDMFWKNSRKLEIGGIFAMPNVDGIMNWLDLSQPE